MYSKVTIPLSGWRTKHPRSTSPFRALIARRTSVCLSSGTEMPSTDETVSHPFSTEARRPISMSSPGMMQSRPSPSLLRSSEISPMIPQTVSNTILSIFPWKSNRPAI